MIASCAAGVGEYGAHGALPTRVLALALGFGKLWKLERGFKPALAAAERERKYLGWQRAVKAVLQHAAAR